jgi:hypothetical protein
MMETATTEAAFRPPCKLLRRREPGLSSTRRREPTRHDDWKSPALAPGFSFAGREPNSFKLNNCDLLTFCLRMIFSEILVRLFGIKR